MVPPDSPSDRELWRLASGGDGSAFGQLFARHATAVYNHLFRRTANWSEAEDLTSAVFLLAWRKRSKVVLDRESALPWLLGIASHTARNAARASRRYRAALARLNPDDQFSADHADAVAAAVDSERLMAELRQAVGRLPRHEREVIELCAWSGLDVKGRPWPSASRQERSSPACTGPGDGWRLAWVRSPAARRGRTHPPPPLPQRRRPAGRVARWAVPLAAAAAVIAIAVTAAALVPLLGHGTAPGGADRGRTGPGRPGPAGRCTAPAGTQCERTESYTVAAALRALTVNDQVGTVTVTGSKRSSVHVTEHQFYRGLPPETRRSVSGGTLTLGYSCRSSDCGVSYVVQIPQSLRVQVSTGTGAIWLRSLLGRIDATADVGSVHGLGLLSWMADLRTDVGSISAEFKVAPARVVARADTGSVSLSVPGQTGYDVTATASLGVVNLNVLRSTSAAHVIRASAAVGSVTISAH
jgi:RNA polymerase sigma-70 factor (ECF subfamily)